MTASAVAGAVVFLEEVYVYRHQLRFVLRFGVRGQFTEFIHKLNAAETGRGWAPPRVWQAMNGLVNEIVIEHDYESVGAFRSERTTFHDDPGEVGEVLAALSALAVPGTASQSDLDEHELIAAEPE
jgi:hypothetical protein